MDFSGIMAFFKSWGLYPTDEDTDDFNRYVIEHGINRACYQQMVSQASTLYGQKFAHYVQRQVNANDDAFYLRANTWNELKEAWERSS